MLKLILLLRHGTFNTARKVALAHRLASLLQLSLGSKRDFTLFSLQNLLCWQRVHTVGKHHKAITMWPHYWFSYFCTIKYWPGSSHEKQNCFPQAAACVPAVLAAWGPASLLTDASSVFFSVSYDGNWEKGFISGMPSHTHVCSHWLQMVPILNEQ